jgi:SAM-dependent methyltransferase
MIAQARIGESPFRLGIVNGKTRMNERPQTWHYGLVARWWAEFNEPNPDELAFYRGVIERNGQPALDLACGAGRLLLPLLSAGLDVDGCDISPDMLAYCREGAAEQGLTPALYQQAMHDLDLPRRYRTIYICDSFGLGGRRDQDAAALGHCYDHLVPGGTLVFSHYLPNDDPKRWSYWLPDQRQRLPEAWPGAGTRKRAADGDEIELRARLLDLDPLEQRQTLEMRAELWREGRLIAREDRLLQENLYFCNEILLMLADAGFADVLVRADYSSREPTADDTMLVFIARR